MCTATTANALGDCACQGEVKIKRNDDVACVCKAEAGGLSLPLYLAWEAAQRAMTFLFICEHTLPPYVASSGGRLRAHAPTHLREYHGVTVPFLTITAHIHVYSLPI